MSTTDSQNPFREPIAIIGSGCRFPGDVNSPSQLWKLLLEPIDLRRQVPAERFAANTFYHPDPSFHGHCNVSSVYPLTEDIRHFDASFFGVKPVEAASIDPQQRLLMEVVYEGLESAGLTVGKLAGSDTGLYVGMMCDDYQTMLSHDHQQTPTYMSTGIARTMAANRISHFFDWHGPSMVLDTACSSSLVAVHLAVQALRAGDCAVALAAGTSLLLGPEFFISESKLNMLSPQGQSRMWDKAADGYARGEGVATVVLKPLRAALADGDHIECVIRDIDINQDGRTPGLTMPSSAAQTALIKEVYRKAGLDASLPQDRCQYFEAHGTGTPAGDPVEAKAIFDAFFGPHGIVATTNEDRPLLVGSIKTILGHTEGTAGLAGMLKASLALQHELIPQNMLLNELNPAIVPFSTHLKVPTRSMLWPEVPSGQPRRASVNSFGFGGTNCHVILESAPLARMGCEARVSFAPFCFSAQSRHSLLRNLANYATFLEEHPDINPADLAWMLRSRRSALPYRLCFAASSIVDLRANIGNFLLLATLDQDAVIRSVTAVPATTPRQSTRIFGVFTGQGAQYARMGAELIEQSAYCAEVIDSLDNILSSLPAEDRPTWTLRDELLQDANPARIHEAGLSQPLCTAIQILLVKLLQLAGIQLTAVVGHSSGEIGAAFAAGIISTRDAIRIAYYRGRYASLAMGPTGKSGAMLAVGTSWEDAQDLCSWDEFSGKVVVAACNSSSSVTLAGDEDALAHIDLILDDEKKFRRWLKVDKAYHSPHMRPCSSPYLCALKRCSIQPSLSEPKCVWVSSVDPDSEAAAPPGVEGPYWNENMLHPVRFMHAIESTLSRVGSFDLAIEIGPHPALTGPVMDTVQKHLPNGLPYTGILYRGKSALTSLKDALLFLHSNMEDGEVDWDTLDTHLGGTTTFTTVPDLPTYQWNHDRKYWHNSPYLRRLLHKKHTVHPILGDISPESSPHRLRWRNVLRPTEIPWICQHRLQSQAVFPAAGYIVAALDAALILAHDRKRPVQLVEIKSMAIHQALAFSSDHDPGVEVVFSVDECHQGQHPESITAGFACSSSLHDQETLQPVASAEITLFFGPPELSILPAPEKDQIQMGGVTSEQFYKSLEALGYDYTGAFKGLFSLQRRLGYSSGLLAVPKPEQYEINPFLIHPAVLDMSIQALLLAYSHPNDGRLRSLFVPTTIETIRINPFALQNAALKYHELSVRATLADRQQHSIEILGDVELTDPTGHHLSVQINGLRAVPFVSPTSANDRQMFARMRWVSATVDAEAVAANTCPDPDDYKLAEILERASCFYLRQVHRQVEEIGGDIDTEGLVAFYSRFASNVTTLVAQGKYPYGLREWMDDELEDIMAMSAPFSQKIEIKTVHLVGGHLPQFIRGEFNMLEHLMADGLLSTYYTNGLSFKKGNEWSGDIVKQMTLRYPQLDILEIGAGTGSATRSILGQIKNQFSSYTFTDISSTFFPKAKHIFHAYGDKIVYRVLDAARDVTDQGFTRHLYDVVVASSVLHATRCLEDTLRNVRSLLKPGGFLVLSEIMGDCPASTGLIFGTLPGWWVGASEGRQLGPNVPPVKWASLLRRTGFSGVDSMTEHKYPLLYHVNVMVSQAIDDWVDFLRHPLWPSSLPVAQKPLDMDLVIIGGTTVRVGSVVVELQRVLRPFVRTISIFQSLDMVEPGGVPAQATVLSLAELDQPVFHDLTPASFNGLKTLFSTEHAILWLTEGREDRNPKASMTAGFARSVLWEAPELHIQFIDLENARVVDSSLLASYLLRHHVARTRARTQKLGSYLQSLEREIRVDQYLHESILRWEPLDEANDRFNSANRPTTYQVSPRASHVVVDRDREGWILRDNSAIYTSRPTVCDQFMMKMHITHSTLYAVNVSAGQQFLLLGVSEKDGRQYLALGPHSESALHVAEKLAHCCSVPAGQEGSFVALVAANFLAMAMTKQLHPGQTLLVHNPTELLASVLAYHARQAALNIIFTTTIPEFAHSSPWVYLHPFLGQRRLQELLPKQVHLAVNMTDPKHTSKHGSMVSSELLASLPTSCHHEPLGHFVTSQAHVLPPSQHDKTRDTFDIATELALQSLITMTVKPDITIPIQQLNHTRDGQNSDLLCVVDWTADAAVPVQLFPMDARLSFPPDRTYWLAGLSSSFGLSLCDWMIGHGARHFVISSRRPHLDAVWLDRARRQGAIIKVAANDITDETSLLTLYRDICAELPPLAGVVHGAMVLRDSPLRDMTYEKMMEALGPKVQGSINLDRILGDTVLDFCIFLSSLANTIGNAGQANYSAANAFLCSLARQRRQRGLNTVAINLGLVIGVGAMRTDLAVAKQTELTKRHFLPVSEPDLHQIFAEAIVACHLDSPCEGEMLTELPSQSSYSTSSFRPVWASDPKFGALIGSSNGATTQKRGHKKLATIADRLHKIQTKRHLAELVTDTLLAHLRSILDLEEGCNISISLRTDQLGMDSLIAVEVRSWLLNNYRANIPVLQILSGITLSDLIDRVCGDLPPELVPAMGLADSGKQDRGDLSSEITDYTPDSVLSISDSVEVTPPSSPTSVSLSIQVEKAIITERKPDESIRNGALPVTHREIAIPSSHRTGQASYSQSMFWFVDALMEEKTTMNHTLLYQISGNLRSKDLERAVRLLSERHEILRTRFYVQKDTGYLLQEVLRESPLRLEGRSVSSDKDVHAAYSELTHHVYDLDAAKSIRMILLSTSLGKQFLLVGYHHIVTDGTSHFIMMADLKKSYNQESFKIKTPLQYLDYTEHEHRQATSNAWQSEIEYWKAILTPMPEPLPSHRSYLSRRQPLHQHRVHMAELTIGADIASRIRTLARTYRATAFHVYLAALKALLYRFLGVEDLCIGIGDANRWEEGMQDSMGPYINLIPLRLTASRDEPFHTAIENSRSVTYEALAHARVPFEVLLNELRVARPATHSPIFQAFMDYRQETRLVESFGDCEMKLVKWEVGKLPYDIFLDVNPSLTGEVVIQVMVQTSLYTQQDAVILSEVYEDILTEMVMTPTKVINDEWNFGQEKINKSMDLGRGLSCGSQWPATLLHQFDAMVSAHSNKTAVRDGDGATLTYYQLMRRVDIIGSTLLRHGVQRNSRIGVYQEPSVDWLSSLLAIMKLGGVFLPLDMTIPIARLALMVENAQPSAVLVHAGTAELVGGLGLHRDCLLINVSELDTSSSGLAIPTCAASNRPAVIFHTSGSTGRPKGIIINHASLQNTIEHSTRQWNLKAEDIILQQSASTFDLSLGQVFQALSVGATLCIASKSMRMDSRAIVDYMFRESVSLTLATPTEYRSWLQWDSDSQLARSSWKTALTAGESVTDTLLGLFRELDKCDLQLYNLYGPTETTLWSTQMKLDYHATDAYLDSVPVGTVCPNEHLYILDDKLRPQPVGIPGEVVIGGLGVAAGYLNLDPEAEASFIPDLVSSGTNRMYRTRDLGRLLPNGDLVLLGRIDDDTEVKLQGVRIDLREIEQTILRIGHNSLVDVAVSLKSASGGTHRFLVAHVVPNPTERERVQDPSTLELLRTRLPLPAVMRPSIIIAVDGLPRTVSAKLDRKALDKIAIPLHLLEQKKSEGCFSIPVQEMKSLWEAVIPDDLLMYHHVHAEADFFHVGGNSMLLIDLHTRICQKYHTSITLFQLFQSSTLEGMAQLVQQPSITRQKQPSVHIDWDVETTPSPSLAAQFSAIVSRPVHSPPRTVILTGATGFLGQHLLRVLTAHPHIRRIICLAVRNLDGARRDLLNSFDKVDVLEGDLTQSNVGVPTSVLHDAFEQADAVIHNGADISQAKTYRSIRPANLSSTQTIISLCSARRIPIHYISTAAISMLSSLDVFPETAAQSSPPPVDGSLGYIASKWASEKYLERMCNVHPDLPAWIYRPSAIIRTRDQKSSSDFTHDLIGFSRRLRAVPDLSNIHGYMDFVSIESATAVIMRELLAGQPNPTPGPSYHHLTGDSVLPLDELRERLAVEVGGNFDVLPLPVWTVRARHIGLSRGMAAVFEGLEHSALQLPRLERGKRQRQLWM